MDLSAYRKLPQRARDLTEVLLKAVNDTRGHKSLVVATKKLHPVALAFCHEVSFVDFPGYPSVIATILDLDCIGAKLQAAMYSDVFSVLDDASQLEQNCIEFSKYLIGKKELTAGDAADIRWCARMTSRALQDKIRASISDYDYKRTSNV